MRLREMRRGQRERSGTWRADYLETRTVGSEEGGWKRAARAVPRQPPILLRPGYKRAEFSQPGLHVWLASPVEGFDHSQAAARKQQNRGWERATAAGYCPQFAGGVSPLAPSTGRARTKTRASPHLAVCTYP